MVASISQRPSSRDSEEGAGWQECAGPGTWKDDVPEGTKPLSWLRPSTLLQSRNDIISKFIADPVPAARARWVELARQRARENNENPDFVISGPTGDSVSLLVIGDPGEGDNSQYAVALPLVEQSKSAHFAVICSDVIYPAGDWSDYGRKFHHPYRDIQVPIYAVPGNHDWYDGLHGFMHQFCRLDDAGYRPHFGKGLRARLARKLWRMPGLPTSSPSPHPDGHPPVEVPPPHPIQPAPYFAIDAGPVRFIGIDTGIKGKGVLDAEQYEWLRRVALGAPERPKILLTGRPIYVDNKYYPGSVLGTKATIDEVVIDSRANFVLAIGGDIHNYQRYPVTLPDGRKIQYVVSGGSGAFMHATHRIPPVDVNGVTESEFRCYPLRRDSLARFSQVISKRLSIDSMSAAKYYQERGVITSSSSRPAAKKISSGARFKAALVRRIPAGRYFHRFGAEVFDFDEPPFFKHFLRIDVNKNSMTVQCLGVTGCAGTEHTPSAEDCFTIEW